MDLGTTNIWLGIIACTVVLQFVAIGVAGYLVMRRLERAQHVIDTLAADVQPLIRRASLALDDVSDVSERLRRAEASVTDVIERVTTGADHLKTIALTRFWPALGVARGLRAAASAMRRRRTTRALDRRLDAIAEARFVEEGGTNARPVRS